MKKLLTLLVAAIMAVACCFGLVGCGGGNEEAEGVDIPPVESAEAKQFDDVQIKSDFKIGVICLHDTSSTYDKNFIDSVRAAAAALGLSDSQVVIATDIPEGADCTTKANELANSGCKAIFADSFGHEDFMIASAQANSGVQYYHATGYKAASAGLDNYHNAFASIYEGRYLAGVAAGMKLKEMNANGEIKSYNKDDNGNVKIGYVGAFTYAEVVSGLTSWYLGVKSQFSKVVMEVQFTGSWYDEVGERTAANTLISHGCALISQHADSMGAPSACEIAGIPNVSYNGSTINECPDTFIISSKIDWTYYFKWIIASVGHVDGVEVDAIPTDFAGSLKNGMVALTSLNPDVMAAGTRAKILELRQQIMDGNLKVFDCSKFTVGGVALTTEDSHVVTENGVTYYAESVGQSAPSFAYVIDGITFLNTEY
nr:BMP family ABC transporter substrate-binding protein [Clostridia bacterium]